MAFTLLGKLLDIEWMLRRDEGRSSAELSQHDHELLGSTAATTTPRQALELWLEGRRRELGGRTLGARASELLTALHLTLAVSALLAGAGTAKLLLQGASAREPTNVLSFVFATLIWPLGLLAGSLLLLGSRGRLGRSVLLEDLYLTGIAALERASRRAPDSQSWGVVKQWRELRRSARRYRDLEVATLLSAAQYYPLAFHAGAALALAASALFSDLAFAWSTTNDSLQPGTLTGLFRVAVAPWCRPLGVGCVTPELVDATRFSRFTGHYASPDGALLSGAWWPALLGCLLVYGVLPRLLLSLGFAALVRRRAARLEERVLPLRGRLHGVTVRVHREHREPDGVAAASALAPSPAPPRHVLPCWVVAWRGATLLDAQLEAVCLRLGLRMTRRDRAGDGDFEHDEALLASGAREPSVLLLADGWEAPDKATRRFVEALRRGSERPVFVGVLLETEDAPAIGIWRDRLGLLADPRVSVEAIAMRPRAEAEVVRA